MEVSGKTIKFSNTLWVQHGGVRVKNQKERVLLEGVDDDSYLKVFNHFGRVLRLYTFEGGKWVDSATSTAPTALDESLAGQVPAAKHTSTAKPAASGPRAKAAGKKTATAKTKAKTATAKKTGAGKAASTSKATAKSKAAFSGKAGTKASKPKAAGKDK